MIVFSNSDDKNRFPGLNHNDLIDVSGNLVLWNDQLQKSIQDHNSIDSNTQLELLIERLCVYNEQLTPGKFKEFAPEKFYSKEKTIKDWKHLQEKIKEKGFFIWEYPKDLIKQSLEDQLRIYEVFYEDESFAEIQISFSDTYRIRAETNFNHVKDLTEGIQEDIGIKEFLQDLNAKIEKKYQAWVSLEQTLAIYQDPILNLQEYSQNQEATSIELIALNDAQEMLELGKRFYFDKDIENAESLIKASLDAYDKLPLTVTYQHMLEALYYLVQINSDLKNDDIVSIYADQTVELMSQQISITDQMNNRYASILYLACVVAVNDQKLFEKSEDYGLKALTVTNYIQNHDEYLRGIIAHVNQLLVGINVQNKNIAQAFKCGRDSLNSYQTIDSDFSRENTLILLHQLIKLGKETNQCDQVLEFSKEVFQLYPDVQQLNKDAQSLIADIHLQLTYIHHHQKTYDKGLIHAQMAITLFRQLRHKSELSFALSNASAIAIYLRDYEKSIEYARESVKILKRIENSYNLAMAKWLNADPSGVAEIQKVITDYKDEIPNILSIELKEFVELGLTIQEQADQLLLEVGLS